jgi:ATP-dependent Clp protease ATP-binding subunit ClpX
MFEGSSDGVGEIKAALDEIVTGQENAKISLAVAIKNHYERVKKGLKKSNILILGPSGSGKTLLVQTIAKKLDVPFALFDATNITQAGYVGGKASDAISLLAEKGEFDKEKIERGIVFLDEIDKMASRSGRSEQDEFKRQGQASLLKMLEGIEVEIEVGRFNSINIDTSNILFVCAGAFTGLKDIIAERLKADGLSLGDAPFEQATAEDLIKYGMAPEFLGRLPNVITLKHLTVEDMVNILKNPKASVLEEYRSIFDARGVEIKFTEGAIFAMAERAVTYNVGARALRTVAESVMSDLQFRVGQLGMLKSITVTERVVRYGDMPTLEYKVQ